MTRAVAPAAARRAREAHLQRFRTIGPFVAASLVQISVRCGRRGCHCATGPGHPSHYLTLKRNGKTVTVYVPKSQLAEVQQWVREHRRVKALVREISELSLEVLRAEARARRRASRPR